MSAPALEQLGKRLATYRGQAGLDVASLSASARVPEDQLRRFERGVGGLGLAALTRIARELGVPSGSLVHTDAPVGQALRAPTILLKTHRVAALSEADSEVIAQHLRRARAFAELGGLLRVEHLCDSFTPVPAPNHRPYLAGYAAAREARRQLPEREGALRDVQRLLENRFDVLVVEHLFTNPAVVGSSCRSGPARLIVVSGAIRSMAQRRFILAHELAHQLLDLEEEGVSADEGGVEDAEWWLENPPAEKRSNAFAAMFLAPEFAVRSLLGTPRPEGYGLKDAQDLIGRAQLHFGISFAAMAWHLLNLEYLRDDDTVRALLLARPVEVPPLELEQTSRFDGLERRVFEALGKELISEARGRELLGGPLPERG